jgi:hypothetical protein
VYTNRERLIWAIDDENNTQTERRIDKDVGNKGERMMQIACTIDGTAQLSFFCAGAACVCVRVGPPPANL